MAEAAVAHWKPEAEHLARWAQQIGERPRGEELAENWLWYTLYDRESGFYSGFDITGKRRPANLWGRDKKTGELTRVKTRMSRREWIERHIWVVDKAGAVVPLRLNRAQRKLESMVLRLERARMPVRLQVLKARQMGFSTYIEACMLWAVLTMPNQKGLVVTDTTERSAMVLNMARTALRELRKSDGKKRWEFAMTSRRKDTLGWDEPLSSVLEVTSAESKAAGRGGTPRWVHMSEGAFWQNASDTLLGLLSALPMTPGTYAFDESTANGESGKFYDDWQTIWPERDLPLAKRRNRWHALFFAWWEHDEYRWTRTLGLGRELPKDLEREILMTLDEEEKWLLRQRYFNRGEGWKPVTVDQLAWRRAKIADKDIGGDLDKFNQENPSRPEVAFMARGGQVFDRYRIQEYLKAAVKPAWTGTLVPKVQIQNMPAPVPWGEEAEE